MMREQRMEEQEKNWGRERDEETLEKRKGEERENKLGREKEEKK